jgi:hypothetical protein
MCSSSDSVVPDINIDEVFEKSAKIEVMCNTANTHYNRVNWHRRKKSAK